MTRQGMSGVTVQFGLLVALLFSVTLLVGLGGCEPKRPSTEKPEGVRTLFNHGLVNTSVCSGCHAEDKPAAFLGQEHGGGQDCKNCHAVKNDSSGWLPRLAFSHNPAPTSCLECHIKDRPPLPHPEGGNCVSCHQYPSWK